MKLVHSLIAAALASSATTGQAAPTFVNGLAIDGDDARRFGRRAVNDGRLGFFSDIYYDPSRNDWWALSDRGPGGGTLDYETRVHRFTLDVNQHTRRDLQLPGVAGPSSSARARRRSTASRRRSAAPLGVAFDPEGIVVHPRDGPL